MRLQCVSRHVFDTEFGHARWLSLGSDCLVCGNALFEMRMPSLKPGIFSDAALAAAERVDAKEKLRDSNL